MRKLDNGLVNLSQIQKTRIPMTDQTYSDNKSKITAQIIFKALKLQEFSSLLKFQKH